MKFVSHSKLRVLKCGSILHGSPLALRQSALILFVLAVALPAFAHPRVSVRYHHLVQGDLRHHSVDGNVRHAVRSAWQVRRHPDSVETSSYHSGGTVTVSTAAGPITVASDAADKFVSLTNDLVAHGFHGSVTCLASGHMPGSLHHTGHACDFAQTARNRTVGLMYHVGEIIAAHGLRDGCSFGDCGHVDTGAPLDGRRFAAASSRHEAEPAGYQNRGGGQRGVASGYGASAMSAASLRPQPGRYADMAARETGRTVVMGFSARGTFARERFVEVGGGAARAFGLARHGLARRRPERM